MNRRNFIQKILTAGAALYVPEKTYSFLFPDKCGSWRGKKYFVMRMTVDANTGLWTPASLDTPDLDCKLLVNLSREAQQRLMSTGIKRQSGWMVVNPEKIEEAP